MPTIKPIDRELIEDAMGKYDYIFTLEEHSKNGGLGTAVGNVIQMCIRDRFYAYSHIR